LNIYLFGDDAHNKTALSYDINYDEWKIHSLAEGSMCYFNQCSASIAINHKEVLVTGGGSPPKRDAKLFNTVEFTLVNKATMIERRNAHAITMCKGIVYVLGGFCGK
jgi:N-acetylneuraminic acid mutarotase